MAECGCGGSRKTVYDYFQHACRRSNAGPPGARGELILAEDGACAQFFLSVEGRALDISYRCTSCVTLIALCEHLAELAASGTARITAEQLLQLHPEIPESKQERAGLAVRAFEAALLTCQADRKT